MSDRGALEMVSAFLAGEGLQPRFEGDHQIRFEYEGWPCLVRVDPDDPIFLRLLVPICSLGSSPPPPVFARNASAVADEVKLAKIVRLGDQAWASIEMMCDPLDRFKTVFRRMLDSAQSACGCFVEQMQGSKDEWMRRQGGP
jgi:hypothetical protein